MLNIVLRRLSRYILPLKIIGLIVGLASLVYFVLRVSPEIGTIVFFSVVLFVTISIILSFFLSANRSLLFASVVSFLLFLKAVNLLSPLNLGLFIVFLVLLGLYLRKG